MSSYLATCSPLFATHSKTFEETSGDRLLYLATPDQRDHLDYWLEDECGVEDGGERARMESILVGLAER